MYIYTFLSLYVILSSFLAIVLLCCCVYFCSGDKWSSIAGSKVSEFLAKVSKSNYIDCTKKNKQTDGRTDRQTDRQTDTVAL